MKDEMEQFERRLQGQPLKEIPAHWREEILAAASAALPARHLPPAAHPSLLSTIRHQLSSLFWPHPKAWAGLAAVWVCILALNFSTREKTHLVAEKTSSAPQPEMVAELKRQKLMYAELMGATELRVADRQKNYAPKPQSKRMEIDTV
jgi:hypothetical protein